MFDFVPDNFNYFDMHEAEEERQERVQNREAHEDEMADRDEEDREVKIL